MSNHRLNAGDFNDFLMGYFSPFICDEFAMMTNPLTLYAAEEQQTDHIARALAEAVVPGLIVALNGDLGAGKTRFSRGLAAGLGVDENLVNSPTYVIIQHYPGRLPIHHFDLYRMRDADEWDELGAEELLESGGICLIEWAERFPDALPADHLEVRIRAVGPVQRQLEIRAHGPTSAAVLSAWQSQTTAFCEKFAPSPPNS